MQFIAINYPVYAIYFRPGDFARRSGLEPLAEAVGAHKITHGCFWRAGRRVNWRVEEALKRWGQSYYGSQWNYLAPVWDEVRIARRMTERPSVAHFLFAEFAGPRRAAPFRARGARVVGTFHASPRRQPVVSAGAHLEAYDCISVVARSQRSFFEARGYPAERIFVTLHGVDTDYFQPDWNRAEAPTDRPLRGLLVGSTERDHSLMASVMKSLPRDCLQLDVATKPNPHPAYTGLANVNMLPHLDDAALLRAYQQADILVMPLLDATANNALLEAMACGTPVLTNRTSGTADYVDGSGGVVVEEHTVEAWVAAIRALASDRAGLQARRAPARAWAERLSWASVAPQYHALYAAAMKDVAT